MWMTGPRSSSVSNLVLLSSPVNMLFCDHPHTFFVTHCPLHLFSMTQNVDDKKDIVIQAPSLYSIAGGEEEENHCMWAYSLGEMAKTMAEVSLTHHFLSYGHFLSHGLHKQLSLTLYFSRSWFQIRLCLRPMLCTRESDTLSLRKGQKWTQTLKSQPIWFDLYLEFLSISFCFSAGIRLLGGKITPYFYVQRSYLPLRFVIDFRFSYFFFSFSFLSSLFSFAKHFTNFRTMIWSVKLHLMNCFHTLLTRSRKIHIETLNEIHAIYLHYYRQIHRDIVREAAVTALKRQKPFLYLVFSSQFYKQLSSQLCGDSFWIASSFWEWIHFESEKAKESYYHDFENRGRSSSNPDIVIYSHLS